MTLREANNAVWEYLKNKWVILLVFVLLSLFVHIIFFQFTSADLEIFLLDWFDYYDQVPLGEALRNPVSNYTGPYTYLLYMAKSVQRGTGNRIPDIAMIKLIDIPFELLTVYLGMMILRFFTDNERRLFYGFALLLFHPILLINGSFWGQCDIIYTSMLLASFMFLFYKKDLWGLIFFGVAVTFKFQAMFFSPLILAMVFGKRIRWYWLGIIPAVYMGLHLPSLIAGRPVLDILMIYLDQAGSMPILTANAPSFYQIFEVIQPRRRIADIVENGLVITVIVALLFSLRVAKRKLIEQPESLLISTSFIVLLMPYIMPSMLDRYFFAAEIFLLLLALVKSKYWFLPLLVTVASLLAYYNSYAVITMGLNATPARIGAVINTLALVFLLNVFLRLNKKEPDQADQVLSELN